MSAPRVPHAGDWTAMMQEMVLERMIFVGGPPRSGTTFAARALNSHPRIVTAIDDHVHECWALYHYPTRTGLVQDLRNGRLSRNEVTARLKAHLFAGNLFAGVAPSAKTMGMPPSDGPRPLAAVTPGKVLADRRGFPLERFAADWYCCLKSPEISFVLPQMAEVLDSARFILVFRPIIEIAESMFRKGLTVRALPVFQRRWEEEKTADGRLIPPPGVPPEWFDLWQKVTGFQRCVIYAASYVKAMGEGMAALPANRCFVYDHARLRRHGDEVFGALASFLGVEASGFAAAGGEFKRDVPAIPAGLRAEYEELEKALDLDGLLRKLEVQGERAAGTGA